MNLIDSNFLSFLLVTLLLTVSPGVDTFIVIRNVLRGGTKDGVCTSFGICSGLFVHATLSVCGISMLLVKSAFLFQSVKTLGAMYLCWLGCVSLFNAAKGNILMSENKPEFKSPVKMDSFREGFLSNVLNPKPAIFYLAFFPQFIQASDHVLLKSTFLAFVQFVVGLSWLILLSFFVCRMSMIVKNSSFRRIVDTVSGSILIAFGFGLLFENNK